MRIKTVLNQLKNITEKYADVKKFFVIIDYVLCALFLGASPNNYILFDLYNASWKERRTYLTHRYNARLMKKYNTKDLSYIFENKYKFAHVFSKYYGREFELSKDISQTSLMRILQSSRNNKIIYKPIRGGQGRDIVVFDLNNTDMNAIYELVRSLPDGIIESWINQHESMNALYPCAVNPIRVQTLYVDGKVHIQTSTITIGNGGEYANASSAKSIFALVDVLSGKVYTDGSDYNGNTFTITPCTKHRILGYQIPYWDEIIEMLQEAATTVRGMSYIGWDIAVTPSGPIIIEGNHDGGYTGYQYYSVIGEHKGIKPLYKDYI